MWGRLAADHHRHLCWLDMVIFALVDRAAGFVLHVYPQLQLWVYEDDMKIHVWGKNQDGPAGSTEGGEQAQQCNSRSKAKTYR